MQVIGVLVPSLLPRISRLSPQVLVELVSDPSALANRLAGIKQLFPSADVTQIINKR